MNLLIVGINHNSAPVELREKIAFTPEQLSDALGDVSNHAGFDEVAILSTCNRTEIIAACQHTSTDHAIHWLAEYHQLTVSDLEQSIYTYTNRDAVRHAIRVASGLDSMVVGEPQILGQFKDCIENARRIGTLGSELDKLSQFTFRIAKQVRTDTAIGENSVSVASTAVALSAQLFSNLKDCRVLLIGAGDTSELVGRHLISAGIINITIANRTLENARSLANELEGSLRAEGSSPYADAEGPSPSADGSSPYAEGSSSTRAIDLQAIPGQLAQADVVIASTAAQVPILGKGTVERALKARKHKPILMVDLAVPRDIEPEVRELRDIYLYSVDDLQEIIGENLENRQDAARAAESIAANAAGEFRTLAETRDAEDMLVKFRSHHEALKNQELTKALARLEKGDDPKDVLTQLANQLTNKIIHTPSIQLKKAASDKNSSDQNGLNNAPELEAIAKLFQLDLDRE